LAVFRAGLGILIIEGKENFPCPDQGLGTQDASLARGFFIASCPEPGIHKYFGIIWIDNFHFQIKYIRPNRSQAARKYLKTQ
jgi:hypothetical protein